MGKRRYRKRYKGRSNSLASIVIDVVHISSKLSWKGALATGVVAYILISLVLGGFIENHIASQEGSQFYPIIEARFGYVVRGCEWVGLACLIVGLFFAIRNYFFKCPAGSTEKRGVSILSKILGRSLD